MSTNNERIFGLDIVRALAILLVVLGHGRFILNDTIIAGFPNFRMIDGVDIFFVLSGFLIGSILLKTIDKAEKFTYKQLFIFWKRRWFRTLPNYYLVLLLNYLVVKYGMIKEDISQFSFHFLTFTHNFKTPFYGFFWESWSLSVEEWFYLITPVLIFLLLKVIPPKISFLLATLFTITAPLLYRVSIYNPYLDDFTWDILFRKTVLCRLDSIGYGLLVAWIHYYFPYFWQKIKVPAFLIGIALILFITNYKSDVNSIYKQITYFSLTPFSVMLFLPIAESYKEGNGFIAASIRHISKISYSMYLINLALVAEVIRDNFTPKGGADGILKYFLFWIIVVGVSTLLYRFFEKPIMDWREKSISRIFFQGKSSA